MQIFVLWKATIAQWSVPAILQLRGSNPKRNIYACPNLYSLNYIFAFELECENRGNRLKEVGISTL